MIVRIIATRARSNQELVVLFRHTAHIINDANDMTFRIYFQREHRGRRSTLARPSVTNIVDQLSKDGRRRDPQVPTPTES